MFIRSAFLTICTVGACAAQTPTSQYPVFETDKIPPAEYKARRQALKEHMGTGSIGVFFTNPEYTRNNDVDFQFRPDSNFWYLTGFEEPDAALVVIPGGVQVGDQRVTEVLFVNESNPMSETWLGYRMGPANAARLLGIDLVLPNTEFAQRLATFGRAAAGRRLFTTQSLPGPKGRLGEMANAFAAWRGGDGSGFQAENAGRFIQAQRQVKSPEEIRLLRKAVDISVLAHNETFRSIQPGMREYEISALVKYIFERFGCEYPGYPPIVGAGPNSTILHYNTNRKVMQAGEIVCMDTAGEYHGYSADITRSFPVNGKFSPEQRAVYEVVLRAQNVGIDMCKPGVSRADVSRAISESLADGLMSLGIIKERGDLRRYYMHGFGHDIGLDVHDPEPNRTLAVGHALTVEPGIYIKAGSPCDQKWWNIGIRIEDNILITPTGNENMSAACPRDVAAIERMMAEQGIGNQPVKKAA